MNVGSLQAPLGNVGQASKNAGQSINSMGSSGFGAVFSNMVTGPPPVVRNESESVSNETIVAILNATTVEEIVEILQSSTTDGSKLAKELLLMKTSTSGQQDINDEQELVLEFLKFPEVEQLVKQLEMNVDKLIEQTIPLLEKAGLTESELEVAKYATNIWSLLEVIDKVAPKFFAELTTSLEGKGAIPKEEAVQLLAMLKAVAMEAPKTDLYVKQEQQVFSLQGFLAVTAEKVEHMQPVNQNRHTVIQMLEAQQAMRIIPQAQTSQNTTNEDQLKEAPKETIQQPVVSATQQTTIREEIRLAQPENTSNARNEALMREMQNIFKRSNFGQTGGTNRLLIKLYPEHLGQVRIELLQVNGIMTARILASSALGREMLDSQLHQLRAAFAQQNLQVDRIDVSQTLQDTSRNERDHAFNQHFKKEQEQTEQQQENSSEEEMTFEEYMIELEA